MALSYISLHMGKTEAYRRNVIPSHYSMKIFDLNSVNKHNKGSLFFLGYHLASFQKRFLGLNIANRMQNLRWIVYIIMLLDPLFLAIEFIWLDIDPPDLSPLVSTRPLAMLSLILFSSITSFIFLVTKSVSTDYTEIDEKCAALSLSTNEYFMNNFVPKKKFNRRLFTFIQINLTIFSIIYVTLIMKINFLALTWPDVFIICDAVLNWYRTVVIDEKIYDLIVSSILVRLSFESLSAEIYKRGDNEWTSEVLNMYREKYFKIIELTVAVNRIWTTFLGILYPLVPMLGVLFLYWFLIQPNHPVRIFFLISISAAIFTVFHLISRNLIAINVEAASIYDPIFRSTLLNKKTEYIVEAHVFLDRIGRNDIGLTMNNIFIINSTSLASIITLVITIVIAFPSFLS
ncbi:uncharacterized protein LOC141851226 [Brevipalpus obovatus]|uniref:uncharacterized protein LOC141851226 n=1 Tax=Brevipalpus obovatus TaxID=246614 RepID=UPI003D9F7451